MITRSNAHLEKKKTVDEGKVFRNGYTTVVCISARPEYGIGYRNLRDRIL